MLISRLFCALSSVALCGACKSKSAPAPSIADAGASIASSSIMSLDKDDMNVIEPLLPTISDRPILAFRMARGSAWSTTFEMEKR